MARVPAIVSITEELMVGAVKETIDQLLPYGTLDTLGHSSLDGHRRMHARTHSRVHTLTHSLTLLGTKHRVQTALDKVSLACSAPNLS